MNTVQGCEERLPPPINVTVGERCNVRCRSSLDFYGEPLSRFVTQAGWIKRKDGMWFEWRWKPEHFADGRLDCGFAGLREDACVEAA